MYKYAEPPTDVGILFPYETSNKTVVQFAPIITGLDKMNMLMYMPYSCYYSNLLHSLSINKILIVIGYGFHDNYINATINSFQSVAEKIIIIISTSKPPIFSFEDNSDKIKTNGSNVFWFDGTFKEASTSTILAELLDRVL